MDQYTNMQYKRVGAEGGAHHVAERIVEAGGVAVVSPQFVRHGKVYEQQGFRVYYAPKLPAWVFDLQHPLPRVLKLLRVLGEYGSYINTHRVVQEAGLDEAAFRLNLNLAIELGLVEHPGGSQKSLQLTKVGRRHLGEATQ